MLAHVARFPLTRHLPPNPETAHNAAHGASRPARGMRADLATIRQEAGSRYAGEPDNTPSERKPNSSLFGFSARSPVLVSRQ